MVVKTAQISHVYVVNVDTWDINHMTVTAAHSGSGKWTPQLCINAKVMGDSSTFGNIQEKTYFIFENFKIFLIKMKNVN